LEIAKAEIASPAEKTANPTRLMVVVYVQPAASTSNLVFMFATDGAAISLPLTHGVELIK
jgi:hypothetical protein